MKVSKPCPFFGTPNMFNYDQTQDEFTFFTDDDIKFATINLDHYSATLLENILLFIDTTSSDGKFSTTYSTTESENIVYNVSNRLKELGFHTSIKTYHSPRSDLITISWQSFYITKYGTMAWKIWERTHNIVSSSYDSIPQELITNILTIDDIISATQGLFNVDAANLFAKTLIAIDASITKGYFTASLSTNESSTLVKDIIDQLDRLGFNTTSVIDSNPLQITIEWDPKSIKKDTVAWNFYEKTCKIRNSSSFTKDYNEVEQDPKNKSDNIDIFYEENLITAAEARSAATKNSTQILDIYNKLFNDITNAINDSITKGRYETFIGIENNQNSDYQEAMKRIIQLLSNKGYIYNKNYEKMCLEIKW